MPALLSPTRRDSFPEAAAIMKYPACILISSVILALMPCLARGAEFVEVHGHEVADEGLDAADEGRPCQVEPGATGGVGQPEVGEVACRVGDGAELPALVPVRLAPGEVHAPGVAVESHDPCRPQTLGRERVVAVERSDVEHAAPGKVGKLVTLQGRGLGDARRPDAAGEVDRVVPERRRHPGAQFVDVHGWSCSSPTASPRRGCPGKDTLRLRRER